jgi:hypothetical protein
MPFSLAWMDEDIPAGFQPPAFGHKDAGAFYRFLS